MHAGVGDKEGPANLLRRARRAVSVEGVGPRLLALVSASLSVVLWGRCRSGGPHRLICDQAQAAFSSSPSARALATYLVDVVGVEDVARR